jgi:HD-like signal output (HDOD) protein
LGYQRPTPPAIDAGPSRGLQPRRQAVDAQAGLLPPEAPLDDFAALAEILRLSRDPDLCVEELVQSVSRAPALAAEVVRIAGSPAYLRGGRIDRLDRAVLILGARTVAEIATAITTTARARGRAIGTREPDALWLHSLSIGVGAELAGRCIGAPCAADAHVVGLLHDLGSLELHDEHGEEYASLVARARAEAVPLERLERQELGCTHGEQIARRLRAGGAPEVLCDALAAHDDPLAAAPQARMTAALVHAAHVIAGGETSPWTDLPHEPAHDRFLASLGLFADDATDVAWLLCERVKLAARTLVP